MEKVQPKYQQIMSKVCFQVKLMIDRILQICIMQFCLQFKTHNTKKLS